MKSSDFVQLLRAAVVDENVAIYRDLFTNTLTETASDTYWQRALALFNSLSPEQQDVFFEVVRQIAVDTTSNVLGVIDGVNSIDGINEEFILTYGDENKLLNGDLQSLFLVEEEKVLKNG